MSNMSVADILKIYGKWIQSKDFVSLVAKKMIISNRHAYRLIKENQDLIRIPLQNRNVIYGLAEFGPLQQDNTKQSSSDSKKDSQKGVFRENEVVGLSALLSSQSRYMQHMAEYQIWLRRGAKPEEKPVPKEKDP